MQDHTVIRKHRLSVLCNALAAILITGAAINSAAAQPDASVTQFEVPAQSAGTALNAFAAQADITLVFSPDVVSGIETTTLEGQYTTEEGLRRMLEGTGLTWQKARDGAIAISKAVERGGEQAETGEQTLETITVTGTRIRGGVSASPTITMDERQFKEEGFTDLGDVIRSIPQNFRGGQNPGVNLGATAGSSNNRNESGGSSLNLRGLGPDATLTLLNGRRLSYDSLNQAIDISAIPIEAVERIEIVPDGASAIYGSDAVGGVANVILKRDFDGVVVGALYGDSADGGLERHDYTVTAGAAWESGGLIGTFKKSSTDPIFAAQRAYTQSMVDPSTLYNGSKLNSGLISAYQRLGERVELKLDALRTVRQASSSNPYPTYYFANHSESTTTLLAPALEISLQRDWMLGFGASRSRGENVFLNNLVRNGSASPSSAGCYCNDTVTWEIGSEGPLVSFGSREVRLAVGVGGRRDEYANRSFLSSSDFEGEQRNRYAYAELSWPVIGSDNARPGVQRLEFSVAGRAEDYDSFGRVTTPKLGVIYDPVEDITLKASWGRSFKAPTLNQRFFGKYTYLWRANQLGCTSCAATDTVLMSFGANQDLEPERARTWTVSLAFHPETLPDLNTEITYFSIDYRQRVAYPFSNILTSLRNPADYSEFISYDPTLDQQQQLISTYNEAFYNQTSTTYDPNRVIAIVSAQYTNVARQKAKGLDLTGSYRFDFAPGQLAVRGGVSWIDLSQQNLAGQDAFDLSGKIYFPAKFNGRLGAVWSQAGLSLSAFANYTSGVTNNVTAVAENGASFTTFDTTARYEIQANNRALAGLAFELSVTNLFNRAPPTITQPNSRFAPFDSTNYSAIGRYVTMAISKTWQ
ncbi:TonB-dependent receptor [Xanthomonas campestris pv. phormiicola]|nr:TonB-dependent receptor [Xanthomonas campestris pv. phormiicola]UYC17394.1 TonB-dependent receptor [Xanthomonas campestris pv. phormiicola]